MLGARASDLGFSSWAPAHGVEGLAFWDQVQVEGKSCLKLPTLQGLIPMVIPLKSAQFIPLL